MKNRLRIAASVYFAVVAVALCVLWVTSQSGAVHVSGNLLGPYDFSIQSLHGGTSIHFFRANAFWSIEVSEANRMITADGFAIDNPNFFFHVEIRTGASSFHAPIWVLVLASGALAAILWRPLPYRFSLRTMLFAMTLLAVVLGLIAWAAR